MKDTSMTNATHNARTNSTAQRDKETLIHPYTNLKAHLDSGPLVITRGDGVRVFGEDGSDYIEAMAGLWCTSLGWSEPRLVDAAKAALDRLPFYHSFTHKVPDVTVDLAERLLAIAPVPMGKVFFANSGSEAVDTALKLVWYINNVRGRPNKKKVIAREKAYHGTTIAAASLTGLPANHGGFDLPIAGVVRTGCPHHYRFAQDGESEEAFATRLAEELDAPIIAEGPDTVAAFVAERVMGAGGVIVPPATYFEKIQAVLKKHDVLLIADEVICGFGRTGNMWGSQTYGITPDILTCADRKSTRLNSSHLGISYAVLCLKKKKTPAAHPAVGRPASHPVLSLPRLHFPSDLTHRSLTGAATLPSVLRRRTWFCIFL